MKFNRMIPLLVFVLAQLALAVPPPQESIIWVPVGVGVEYNHFELPGPIQAYVARMDRTNTKVSIDSALANGMLGWGFETVSKMAQRYNQSVSFRDDTPAEHLGDRTRVVVAINGSFVEPNGAPQSGQVISGWYAKRFNNLGGTSGFGWTNERNAFIGECVTHIVRKQVVAYPVNGNSQEIAGINVARISNQMVLYTPHYGLRTPSASAGVEVVVDMSRPTMILPLSAYASGVVREIRPGQGETPLLFDSVVLSADGDAADTLLDSVKIGDEVRISQEITSYEENCETPKSLSWTKTHASIGGSFFFLQDGEVFPYEDDKGATDRHPRTAIAYNDQYVFFIVVDGRQEGYSIGMTIAELAAFAHDYLGAEWAIAQDGGGSSTMVINGVVVNQPAVTCYWLYVPTVIKEGDVLRQEVEPVEGNSLRKIIPRQVSSINPCQRPVGNGMMMTVLESAQFSTTFAGGQTVVVASETLVRAGPGDNYGAFASIAAGVTGTVLPHANGLDGVFAKGASWWKVSIQGIEGWVPEGDLRLINP